MSLYLLYRFVFEIKKDSLEDSVFISETSRVHLAIYDLLRFMNSERTRGKERLRRIKINFALNVGSN